jgi:hypothetical protein
VRSAAAPFQRGPQSSPPNAIKSRRNVVHTSNSPYQKMSVRRLSKPAQTVVQCLRCPYTANPGRHGGSIPAGRWFWPRVTLLNTPAS